MDKNIKITDHEYKISHAESAIKYTFKNKKLLLQALTHPSANAKKSYERLEFLGDSLLGARVSLRAFELYPNSKEGELTHIKVACVSGENLSEVAQNLELGSSIIFGRSETSTGKRGLKSALENIFEAIVAAIYLDGGEAPMNDFIERTIISSLQKTGIPQIHENPKSLLQEKLQMNKMTPVYSIIDEFGPAHSKKFVAEVKVGDKVLASGSGRTKKEAEADAAAAALKQI